MSDLRTAREYLAQMFEIPTSGEHPTKLNLCLSKALHDLRPLRFQWNVAEWTLTTVIAQDSYPKSTAASPAAAELPRDLLAIQGPTLQISVGGSLWPLELISPAEYERLKSSIPTRAPNTWRYWDNEFWPFPVPDAALVITGRYHQDLGTPLPIYDGANWTFEVFGSAIDENTFSNSWFTEAFFPLCNQAGAYYRKLYSKDPAGAQQAAEVAQTQLTALLAEYGVQEDYGELQSRGGPVSGQTLMPPVEAQGAPGG